MYLKHILLLLISKRYRFFRMKYELADKYQGLDYNYKNVYNDYRILQNKSEIQLVNDVFS